MGQVMKKSVAAKMGIRPGARTYFCHVPEEVMQTAGLPDLAIANRLSGHFDYIHLFVKTKAAFQKEFPRLRDHLQEKGRLWVSWPKAGQLNTDLNLKIVIQLGYDLGMVESTCLSIDEVWSAIKFTHPLKGKTYNNSYGKLPDK